MQTMESFFDLYRQNNKLSVRLISPDFGHLPGEITQRFGLTHRKSHYFFLFMLKGHSQQRVDLEAFDVKPNELLFILPHQIHQLPSAKHGKDYFKLGFDEHCLSLLPKQYPFLINPLNSQKIKFTPAVAARLKALFELLLALLQEPDTDPELILAHLNSVMTEINAAYFLAGKTPVDGKLSKYIQFKLLVEARLTEHMPIEKMAEELALNTNSLYHLVKYYAGVSPKEFITKRLMLEAKRQLYYSEHASIKELAYHLGFNDPEYFGRLFKKETGQSITLFIQDLSG